MKDVGDLNKDILPSKKMLGGRKMENEKFSPEPLGAQKSS